MRISVLSCVLAAAVGLLCGELRADEPGGGGKQSPRGRAGVFDSRAVAIAYARSEAGSRKFARLMDEHKKAKAAGDAQKARKLEAEGEAQQEKLHLQGFGTASVADILESVKGQLPDVAKKAGVDVIVSKWDVVYQLPGVELIDVTDQIVEPFKPDRKTADIIRQLRRQPPVSADVIRQHKDH